jgi:predicted dehydrogenase
MALDLNECQSMIDARDRSGKKLMIGHCIRFWPEYVETKRMLEERRYGQVKSAVFRRLSPTPTWSCQNWILDQDKSGGSVLDLHVHDVDFMLNVFGRPDKVTSFGNINVAAKNSGVDYVLSRFSMDSSALVIAEGGWHFHQQFPFSMTFTIRCEDATICFDAAGQNTLAVYKADGSAEYPEMSGRTGWEEEISYFIDCVANDKPVDFSPAEDSMLAVEVALAERESVVNNTSVVLA